MILNKDLRKKIIEMIYRAKEGHVGSSFSIVDIIEHLYAKILRYRAIDPLWPDRDYFILSKGHGGSALYVVLHKYGFLTDQHLETYSQKGGILGGHPDRTCVPGVEASTGSLGHGFSTAMGLALGLKIQDKPNRVFTLLGDGECHEGTIWESANVANNRRLGNLCAIIDWNGSAAQLMPRDNLPEKWRAFGWDVFEVDGHNSVELDRVFNSLTFEMEGTPKAVVAHNIKGKGVSFTEGHGKWHSRIPDDEELAAIFKELS